MPLLFALVFGVFLFSSCNKSDVLAREESLAGNWIITGIRSDRAEDWDGDGFTETDIYQTYNSCERDIQLYFEEGGYGQIREGCDVPAEELYWQLTNNNQHLLIEYNGGELDLDLIQFSSRTIRGTDLIQYNGRTYEITYTLSRR